MALPAVTEVFKGSIDESLKKLVQPAGIVPATVLVVLNLSVIYPRLVEAKVPAAVGFGDLDDTWKVVIVSALVLIVGYIILNLSGSAMRLATGEMLLDSSLGNFLADRERSRIRHALERAALTNRLLAENARLPRLSDAAPTRLGNVFAGANRALETRYGFDMAALWAHLEAVLRKDEEQLAGQLEDEYTGLQVLVNLAVVVLIVGAEAAVVTLSTENGDLAALSIGAIPVAYGLYRAAAARARSYTDLVEVAVDMYRSKVGEKLGVKTTDDPAADRSAWRRLGKWLLWDEVEPPDAEATLEVTTTSSENVTVKALPTRIGPPRADTQTNSFAVIWDEHYGFLIGGKVPDDCCDREFDGRIALAAGKEWQFDATPTVELDGRTVKPELIEGGTAGDSLLIRTRLRGNEASDMFLTFPRRRLGLSVTPMGGSGGSVKVALVGQPKLGASTVEFDLTPDPPVEATRKVAIVFRASWMAAKDVVFFLGGKSIEKKLVDGAWTGTANLQSEARLVIKVPDKPLAVGSASTRGR